MRYREYLRQCLGDIASEGVSLPSGYHLVGDVILLTVDEKLGGIASEIGKATLHFEKRARSVAVRTGPTYGTTRKPRYQVVAGDKDTITEHTENGVKFRFDPLLLTFSGGNMSERIVLPMRVRPDEHVLDMFACVGQFALHVAKNSDAFVTAIEINPDAYRFLLENIKLNSVSHSVNPILDDCRNVEVRKKADRIIMGYLHDTITYLPYALNNLSQRGGNVHLHTAIPRSEVEKLCNTINTISMDMGFEVIETRPRIVKNYAPKVIHYVFDIELTST